MTTADKDVPVLPTGEDEEQFWALVEQAWEPLGPEPQILRRRLTERLSTSDEVPLYEIDQWIPGFLSNLKALAASLSAEQLTKLDRVLERRLYDIDRADIQAVTDGSDDGFLYCRGFIVAMGQAFYTAVIGNPEVAILDAECEAMCYFFANRHRERFGDYPQTRSGISRESVSNPDGWPSSAPTPA